MGCGRLGSNQCVHAIRQRQSNDRCKTRFDRTDAPEKIATV